MDKKTVTRRVALGAVAGGLAGTALVIRALKARYDVTMPSGTGNMKVTRKYRDRDITLDVPLKRPSTPEEQKEMGEQLLAQLKKNPTYIEAETEERLKHRDAERKEAIDHFADLEKRELADLAKQPFTEEQKQAAAKTIKESIRVGREKVLAQLDKLAQEYVDSLSTSVNRGMISNCVIVAVSG